MLFAAGNRIEPPVHWSGGSGAVEFLDFLAKKEFRAAIALSDVKLYTDALGAPVKIQYDELIEGGFTPVVRAFGLYSSSESDDAFTKWWRFEVLPARAGVIGKCEVRVRLGQPWRSVAESTTGYPVPFVSLGLSYKLWTDGSGEVDCVSSDIPSQRWYSDWQAGGQHDMMSLSQEQISSFFSSGVIAPRSRKWAEKFEAQQARGA